MLSLSSIRLAMAATVALVIAAPFAARAATIYSNNFSGQTPESFGDPSGFGGYETSVPGTPNDGYNNDSTTYRTTTDLSYYGNVGSVTGNTIVVNHGGGSSPANYDTFGEVSNSGTVGANYAANTTYTFSVLGATSNAGHSPSLQLSFVAGSTFETTSTVSPPSQNAFTSYQVTLDTALFPSLVGSPIEIAFGVSNTVAGNTNQVAVDVANLLVTSAADAVTPPSIPEPASVSLIAIGAATLLARRRRSV